jgi:hypothetical protein
MKKLNLTVAMLLMISGYLMAQNSMKDFFQNKAKVTFFGYDFSQARFIGTEGFNDPYGIKNKYLPGLNDLIVSESEKFSIMESFKINPSNFDISVKHNKAVNEGVDVESIIMTEGSHKLDKDALQGIVSGYDFGINEGIGITYIVESLNKNENKATLYIVFIDLSNNKILHAEYAEGKARGFGWRNFWAGAMYSVKKEIDKDINKKLRKQFM